MGMPGMTAAASLGPSMGRYAGSGQPWGSSWWGVGSRTAGVVQPAAAIHMDGRFVCYGEIDDLGRIRCYTSGGPEPTCRPSCSRCRAAPDGGRVRYCIKADCDLVERPC